MTGRRTLNRHRNRIASLRDMPVLYEFNDHPRQPRFTMHRRGELTMSVVVDGRREQIGTIRPRGSVLFLDMPSDRSFNCNCIELLALGRSCYQTLLTKFEVKHP